MKMKDIPKKTFKKLDAETQAVILDYVNNLYPDKGYSEKIEEFIKEKIKEVT